MNKRFTILIAAFATALASNAIAGEASDHQKSVMKKALAGASSPSAKMPTGIDIKGGSTFYVLDGAGSVRPYNPLGTNHPSLFWANQDRYAGSAGAGQ